MDNDMWTMEELGQWFNKYAKDEAPEPRDPTRGGYLVPAPPRSDTHDANGNRYERRQQTPLVQAPAPALGVGRMATPAYHDFEGCLKQQQHNSQLKLQERHFYPPQEPGRVTGFRRAPWLDRAD